METLCIKGYLHQSPDTGGAVGVAVTQIYIKANENGTCIINMCLTSTNSIFSIFIPEVNSNGTRECFEYLAD